MRTYKNPLLQGVCFRLVLTVSLLCILWMAIIWAL